MISSRSNKGEMLLSALKYRKRNHSSRLSSTCIRWKESAYQSSSSPPPAPEPTANIVCLRRRIFYVVKVSLSRSFPSSSYPKQSVLTRRGGKSRRFAIASSLFNLIFFIIRRIGTRLIQKKRENGRTVISLSILIPFSHLHCPSEHHPIDKLFHHKVNFSSPSHLSKRGLGRCGGFFQKKNSTNIAKLHKNDFHSKF